MKNLQKKLQILTIAIVAGFLFFGMTLTVEAYIQKSGTVNEAVVLRQNADNTSNQVMELASGKAVVVNNEIKAADGTTWYQVIVDSTNLGYVPASTVTISDSAVSNPSTAPNTQQVTQTVTVTERIGTVNTDGAIRVRKDATTSSDQIASMQPGDTFKVLEDVNAADGYVWHKAEFDDNGTMVVGFVRSDLVKVEEVTRTEQQVVDVPVDTTPPVTEPEKPDAPYTIDSKVNAEGTTVWYLTDTATGTAKEISSLLAEKAPAKSNNNVYKIIVVILLILVLLAAGAATFFFMRWRDAEEFITELREKQARAKKQQGPATRTTQGAQPTTKPSNGMPKMNLPERPGSQSGAQPRTTPQAPANAAQPRPAAQAPANAVGAQGAAPRPAAQASANAVGAQGAAQPRPAAQTPVNATGTQSAAPQSRPVPQSAAPQPTKSEVLPNTMDIVAATQQELKNSENNAAKQNKGWKSKNFLTDDDDLEFDFLDGDDK